MRANEETLKGEIIHLKAENGNLKLKVNHMDDNTGLKKLIGTMNAIQDQDSNHSGQIQLMSKATKPPHWSRPRSHSRRLRHFEQPQ